VAGGDSQAAVLSGHLQQTTVSCHPRRRLAGHAIPQCNLRPLAGNGNFKAIAVADNKRLIRIAFCAAQPVINVCYMEIAPGLVQAEQQRHRVGATADRDEYSLVLWNQR
jgi:hypothetical protein